VSYAGKRVVVCIPYGRRRTVSILLNYLRRDKSIIDEVQFWMNTDPDQTEDVAWAHEQAEIFDGWVKCVPRPVRQALHPKQLNTGYFYKNTREHDTLYFRFDDDIVYVHPDYFPNMVNFRLANPDYFLVMGSIWNNAILSYIHQQNGLISKGLGVVESAYCMDPVGWTSPKFAVGIHNQLIKMIKRGDVERLFFDRYDLVNYKRFSISNFVWTGEDCDAWGGHTQEREEENWLTGTYPQQIGRINTICGTGFVSHYSFFDQRHRLDKTDILDQYRELSQDALSSSYYSLLGESNK
jgi:hypothetical protein